MNQEGPTSVLERISTLPPPPATANELPTQNPEPVSSSPLKPSGSAILPPTIRDAPTSARDNVSIPTPPPTTTKINREVPVPAPNPDAVSTPLSPAKTTSASSIAKTAGNGLVVALKLLKEAVTGVGVPGLEATVSGVVAVIDLIQDIKDNAEAFDDLDFRISALAHAMSSSPDLRRGAEVDGPLRSRIDGFLLELHRMLMKVQQMLQDKNFVSRTANSKAHKDAIGDINTKIDRLQSRFTTEGILSVELGVSSALREIQMLAQSQKAQEYEARINAIPRAHAHYNDTSTKPSRPCHPGTRMDLLQTIRRWIYGGSGTTPYFWLCGEVGVGKTTVAHTIAQENEALQQLGACFFFSRHDESRRTPYLLFTSIAYQLARFDPGFYKALAEILKPNPDIVKRTPMEQFKQLVLEPIIQSGIESSRTVVIVIDGLDECSDPASILDVLTLGIDNIGVRLRVLISSRPYAAILSKFQNPRLYYLTSETQFRDINPEVLNNDVTAYLFWEMGAIASRWQLPSPWPAKAQLDELIRRIGGLFIIASTYTKYLENPEVGNPADQLERILSRRRKVGSSPLAELDALYDQVLDDLKSRLPSDVVIARDILAFVIHGEDDITIRLLAGLLSVNSSDVRLILRHLTAFIPLPKDNDAKIVPFHASFGEYIQDSTRCTVREFSVGAKAAYGLMAVHCSHSITSAVKAGITGGEYISARGWPWIPVHLHHAGHHLHSYLSRSPPAQVEETRMDIIGTGVLAVFRMASTLWTLIHSVKLINALGGLEGFLDVKGSSVDEIPVSLGILIIENYTLEINRISEKARKTTDVKASQLRQWHALNFNDLSKVKYSDKTEPAGNILRNVRRWMEYDHSHIMSFSGVDVKLDGENILQEVHVFVNLPNSIRHSSSLHGYLEMHDDLDMASKIFIALNISDGLHCLHGSNPPQPHNGINPHQIMVSEEGQPILYPSKWCLEFLSQPPPNEKNSADNITCRWSGDYSPPHWYHWYPSPGGGRKWQESLEARLGADVWDFGSLLYRMITGEEPLTSYNRLAKGNEALGYDPARVKAPGPWQDEYADDPWSEGRYEESVLLLLDMLQASGDVKELVRSCWAVQLQDRPSMREVFECLKKIAKKMGI